eukprot:13313846-Heterocapsa_arctica.AAC.1
MLRAVRPGTLDQEANAILFGRGQPGRACRRNMTGPFAVPERGGHQAGLPERWRAGPRSRGG